VTEATALEFILNHYKDNTFFWQEKSEKSDHHIYDKHNHLPKGQLVLCPVNGDFKEPNFRLAWKFDVYSNIPLFRKNIYIDAEMNGIIWSTDLLCHTNAAATGSTLFSGNRPFMTDSLSSSSYRLRETGRGFGIETYNCNFTTNKTGALDFTNTTKIWTSSTNNDQISRDIHWGSEMVYDYYFNTHGRNSYDNLGSKLLSYGHYSVNYANAFWDGSTMTYGDGNGSTWLPLVCIDVCGHEVTHGVTQNSAGLIYSGESGAQNESFSDIFGNVIENVNKPATASWNMGEEFAPSTLGIRSMSNPNLFGNPDTYLGTFWSSGGVHNQS
jgi:bacillolysin